MSAHKAVVVLGAGRSYLSAAIQLVSCNHGTFVYADEVRMCENDGSLMCMFGDLRFVWFWGVCLVLFGVLFLFFQHLRRRMAVHCIPPAWVMCKALCKIMTDLLCIVL